MVGIFGYKLAHLVFFFSFLAEGITKHKGKAYGAYTMEKCVMEH